MAATVFSDSFASSTLNSPTPASPTTNSTSYQLISSKTWSPTPSIGANNLTFGIAPTTSGQTEVQARFSATPVALTNTGDFIELTVTFTNTTGLLNLAGHVGFGLYNSAGANPVPGGLNGTATSNNLATGNAQLWQGYVARIAYTGGSHRLAIRPVQFINNANNQDVVCEGSSSSSYSNNVNLASAASTFSQANGTELTEAFRITLTAANTFQLDSRLFLGNGTNGTLLLSQSTSGVTGANFITNTFDALAIGWRATANTAATRMDINSITVVGPGITEPPSSNVVAGIAFQQQPTTAAAGATLTPAVTVLATNVSGQPVTNVSVTLSLISGSGPFNGTLTQTTDVNGLATFNNLSFTSAGTKQLQAAAGAATTSSSTFNITPAIAAALAFVVPPSESLTNTAIVPAPTVQVLDAYGNLVSTNGVSVTMALSSGTGSLNGTTSANTDANGLATFSNLRLSQSGTKQLTASATALSSAVSASFRITNLPSQTPAFPGAEGAGKFAKGGRGGDVYYVTSLSDANTAGTLRYGINNAPAGGRTILFKVSGNIVLSSTLTVNKPRITIAGQSAPGDGICFQNYSFNIAAGDVVLRHLRTRLGTNALQEADAMWINAGTNVIVDHLSASWSVDETLSASRMIENLTVQNCFITESLWRSTHSKGEHGYGGIISTSTNSTFSYHHNLYAHHTSRNPRVGSDIPEATLLLDFRNNVVYNWGFFVGYSGDALENVAMNYVSNYFIAGPNSTQTAAFSGGAANHIVFQSGNRIDNNKNGLVDGTDTGWSMFAGSYTQTNTPVATPALPTDTPGTALQRVIALSGALPWRRDAYDQRIARTLRQQNGRHIDFVNPTTFAGDYITNNILGTNYFGVNPWPTLTSLTAPTDFDNDGMADYWELALGLATNNAADRNLTNSLGYTRLEDYLNWLAEPNALCPRNGTVDISLRQIVGGDTNLTFAVTAGTNGSVSLLGDGFTARFIATNNFNGLASFGFSATQAVNGLGFGPVNVGVLVTTTNAANTAPVLVSIPNYALIAGNTLTFTNSATDADVPAQTLTYSLLSPPAGASVNASNGVFNWRPTIAQGGSSNSLALVVTDSGTPALSATQTFGVLVNLPTTPSLATSTWTNGVFRTTVSGSTGPDYAFEASTNLLNWVNVATQWNATTPFLWSDTNSFPQRFYRVRLGP
jgi:hypothetical protein